MCNILYTYHLTGITIIYMNNTESIILIKETQISIYTLFQYSECIIDSTSLCA